PPGTRRLDVTCDHVTVGLQAMRHLPGVRSATVFGQSMHLLVDQSTPETTIHGELSRVGIREADIRPIGPSLEDVFVALTGTPPNGKAEQPSRPSPQPSPPRGEREMPR